jgi:hypothetical protein
MMFFVFGTPRFGSEVGKITNDYGGQISTDAKFNNQIE